MIPRTLFRTTPADTTDEVEAFWHGAVDLTPGWRHVTYRDPLDASDWPLTGPVWPACGSGAQRAGLIRLEALWRHGGVYIDSDVELYRPLDELLWSPAFCAWEDRTVIPDAVLAAHPHHPAIRACIKAAIDAVPAGAWASGPGVTTAVLASRPDVVKLPPGSFYPYHYTEKHRRHDDHHAEQPWAFGAHHWHGSWLP